MPNETTQAAAPPRRWLRAPMVRPAAERATAHACAATSRVERRLARCDAPRLYNRWCRLSEARHVARGADKSVDVQEILTETAQKVGEAWEETEDKARARSERAIALTKLPQTASCLRAPAHAPARRCARRRTLPPC